MAVVSDDLTLHPRVRRAIYEGNRDRPLTLNWAPREPDAYDRLALPALGNRNAMKARTQIITEALAAGERFVSYSRDKRFYTYGQRYYRPTYTYHSILPAIGQLADVGLLETREDATGASRISVTLPRICRAPAGICASSGRLSTA